MRSLVENAENQLHGVTFSHMCGQGLKMQKVSFLGLLFPVRGFPQGSLCVGRPSALGGSRGMVPGSPRGPTDFLIPEGMRLFSPIPKVTGLFLLDPNCRGYGTFLAISPRYGTSLINS